VVVFDVETALLYNLRGVAMINWSVVFLISSSVLFLTSAVFMRRDFVALKESGVLLHNVTMSRYLKTMVACFFIAVFSSGVVWYHLEF